MTTNFSQKVWYRTKSGIIFLAVLSFIGLIAVAFAILIGYYFWQLKFGDAESIISQFEPKYSQASELTRITNTAETISNTSDIIRPYNPVLGNPDAPITIIAFIDFECPYCAESYPIFREVTETYGPAIRVIFKHLPLASIHPNAVEAALAATCAQDQGTFWPYYTMLFEEKTLNQAAYVQYAKDLGLNESAFSACLAERRHEPEIEQDLQDAIAIGAKGTPTYIIEDQKISGVIPKQVWDEIILESL